MIFKFVFFTDWGLAKSNQRGREESWWKAINSGNITSIRVWARWCGENLSYRADMYVCVFPFPVIMSIVRSSDAGSSWVDIHSDNWWLGWQWNYPIFTWKLCTHSQNMMLYFGVLTLQMNVSFGWNHSASSWIRQGLCHILSYMYSKNFIRKGKSLRIS